MEIMWRNDGVTYDIAVRIGKDLNLNMARIIDIFLYEHPVIAEGRFGFSLRKTEAAQSFFIIPFTKPRTSQIQFAFFKLNRKDMYQAILIPLPPPPALALIITGYPIS